jgi:NADH dehydrogenase
MQGLVTVFGGSGFVGAQVVRALARKGLRVRVAVRNTGRGYKLRMLGDVGQIEIVQANVRNRDSVARALDGASGVVNAVGATYQAGRQTFDAVHVDGARLIAEVAASRGITALVQLSGLGVEETSASKYSAARARGEAAVRAVLPSAVIIRPSVVFGPDDVFFNRLAQMVSLVPVMPLIGGGASKLQPVYVADVAAAVAAAVTDPSRAGQTFEIGGPAVYSFRELVELVMKETGKRRPLLPLPNAIANVLGRLGEIQGAILPITPIVTRDQVVLLSGDNVVTPGVPGLAELGVTPTALEPILPTYLYRYRKGGQFAEIMAQA